MDIRNITDLIKYIDPFDAVIFDLDDTLYNERDYVRSGYSVVATRFPKIKNMEQRLWKAFLAGQPAIDAVLSEESKESEKEICLEIYRSHSPKIKLLVGVEDMLFRLRKDGKKLGMITDGRPEGQRAKIEALHLDPLFDEIIITDELGGVQYRKPNETSFRIMSEKLNVPYKEMVYIGDNPLKDFIAPKKLGMGHIWFRNKDGLYQ